MARKLRIEFPGAIYHVINRGNYRRDLFVSPAEAQAFLATLREAAARLRWRVHAYALMRNHYHVALETPEPNLVVGMHWLQSTWATRFNRFRHERGHLFQGRYQSLLIEDAAVLARVVDYIHLNPVRAKIVPPAQVRHYRWTSLLGIVRGATWVDEAGWRAGGRFAGHADERAAYEQHLISIGSDEASWESRGLRGLSRGWAIGTQGWRRAVAKQHGTRALLPGALLEDVQELRVSVWEAAVEAALAKLGRQNRDLATKPRKQPWKLSLATTVRRNTGAPVAWLAARLQLGKPATLRAYLSRHTSTTEQRTTA